MTDTGRQGFTDKVESAVKPDSQKSTFESAKDTVLGKADSAAAKATPEEDKSFAQKASDAIFGESK